MGTPAGRSGQHREGHVAHARVQPRRARERRARLLRHSAPAGRVRAAHRDPSAEEGHQITGSTCLERGQPVTMEGIEWGRSDAFLDEIPGAYKPVEQVMADAADLVEIRSE